MLGKLWPKTRKSHPLSKLLRPAFEGKKPKRILGAFLVVTGLFSRVLTPAASAFETYPKPELVTLDSKVEVDTQKGVRWPLKKFRLSQGYWFLHPAVDLAAPKGTPVYPVMAGTVEKIEYGRFGYGNNIIINHGNKLSSLYAHLSKIEVKEGEAVNQETIIGLVGSTGLATGNHLHLEIRENGRFLNPEPFLR